MENIIGFSTGSLYKLGLPLIEKVKLISKAGCRAIEFMFLIPEQLDDWSSLQENDIKFIRENFDYVSLHAPVEGVVLRINDSETDKILDRLSEISRDVDAKLVTFHADTIGDVDAIKKLSFPISVENLTDREGETRTLEEMNKFLEELPSASVTFDTAHAFNTDSSGKLARDLVNGLGQKIVQAHISGVKSGKNHILYHTSDNDSHFPIIKSLKCPLIHEGVIERPKQVKAELSYIREKLR